MQGAICIPDPKNPPCLSKPSNPTNQLLHHQTQNPSSYVCQPPYLRTCQPFFRSAAYFPLSLSWLSLSLSSYLTPALVPHLARSRGGSTGSGTRKNNLSRFSKNNFTGFDNEECCHQDLWMVQI
jgi:hypothetical protein